eukprot:TRINITY_DN8241_c0_g1_i1.p1 TRINITY_DN8241_c0_g1~~TRINITY_DN8241_c0_g1_i1.p1  ORF type:complete len:705 (+),score=266.57 TRINITY_DN8241_c0_g1_i1:46-2115(+)
MADVLAAVSGRTNENNDVESGGGTATPSNAWGQLPTDTGGTTPSYQGMDIFTACQSGNLGVVILLWYKGVSVTHRDPHGASPLHQAAYNGHLRVCKFLVDQGAEVDAENVTGNTPIMWATCGGHYPVVRYLASKGASLSKKDSRGYSVPFHAVHTNQCALLHWVATEHPEIDLTAVDGEGHNLFQWGAYKGFLGACRYLHEVHRLSMEVVDKEGRTSLHWVAREGHMDVAEYMLSKETLGMSFTHRDNNGLTPAEAADSRFHPLVAKYIRKYAKAGTAPPKFGEGKEASTISLLLNNGSHLRRLLYGVFLIPLFFFYATNYIPSLLIAALLPFLLVLPPSFDAHLFRGGQPPVRVEGMAGSQAPNLSQQIVLLSIGGERNLTATVAVAILQVLIPFRFFYFNTPMYHAMDVLKLQPSSASTAPGDYVQSVAPMAYDLMFYAWGAGLVLFIALSAKSPQRPQLPATDAETGGLKISATPGAYCFELMERKSLRSVYNKLTNRVVAGFDHFSVLVDNDIGKGNRGLYLLWLMVTAAWLGAVVVGTYAWAVMKVAGPDANYTVCRIIGNFVSTAMPGGDPTKTSIIFPTQNEVTAGWCGAVGLMGFLFVGERILNQLQNIAANVNNYELIHGDTVPVTGQGLCSVLVKREGQPKALSMFNKGSPYDNLANFVCGSEGYNSISEVATREGYRP